jgi:Uma2 family endonuclease
MDPRRALAAGGLFDPERWELIGGDLFRRMPKKRPHVHALAILTEWLVTLLGGRFVNSEAPINVAPEDNPTSEPQPDLIVLRAASTQFRTETPGPADLQLVVEISDTTLEFDMTVKARLYARAGIREYWVLDVNGRSLIVQRKPLSERYRSIVAYGETEAVAPLARPEALFRVQTAFQG